MKKVLLLSILLVSFTVCIAQTHSNKMENKDCFSPENFLKVKEYIILRLGVSGMGKFYVEYPPDSTRLNDGVMRPSNHPENVFDIRFDETTDQIVFENETVEFNFHSEEGLVYKKNQTEKEHCLANDIFCYLLDNYYK
ncbi:hypothetical protein ACFLSV_00365 [Bacteroidota bacterium]